MFIIAARKLYSRRECLSDYKVKSMVLENWLEGDFLVKRLDNLFNAIKSLFFKLLVKKRHIGSTMCLKEYIHFLA